ncbi:MAG: DoxX family membrane protein [bacterium]|nr:DoxX family membrane protein [bacterium]
MRTAAGRLFDTCLRLFLGGLFVYASIHKIQDPQAFARIIYGYRILPAELVNAAAIILPGVELVAGALLIAGLLSRGATLVIAACLAVFIAALAFNIARGLEFDCGCLSFAASRRGAAVDLLIRDILFLAMAARLLAAPRLPCTLDRLLGLDRGRR